MRSRDRLLVSAGWVLAILVSAAAIILVSCGGPASSGSPPPPTAAATLAPPSAQASPSVSPTSAWTPAPSAGPPITGGEGELRDASGKVVAKLTGGDGIDSGEFVARVARDSAWTERLENARALGFTAVESARVNRYDDGTAVTSAVLVGRGVDRAVLVRASGTMSGAYLVRPVFAGSTVSALELSSADGTVTLDLANGKISGVDAHHSCSYWNCLAGALYFWIDENGYWDEVGTFCDYCFGGGICDACLAVIPVATLASVVECGIAPCSLCYSDACGSGTEVIERWCSATEGAAQVYERVRTHRCQNARTADSECVEQVDRLSVEVCWNGCAGNNCAPVTCTTDVDCPRNAQDLAQVCVQGIPDVNPNVGQVFRYTQRSECDTTARTCRLTCVRDLIDVCAEGCWDSPPGSTGTAVLNAAPACGTAASVAVGTGRCFNAAACTHDEDIWIRTVIPGSNCGSYKKPCYEYNLAPRECFTDPMTGTRSVGQPYRHYRPVRLPNGAQTCTWEVRHRDVTTCTAGCLNGTCNPTCDPGTCNRDVWLGREQCSAGLVSAAFRHSSCQLATGGGSYCATEEVRYPVRRCVGTCDSYSVGCAGGWCSLDCEREEPAYDPSCTTGIGGRGEMQQIVRQYYCDSAVTSGDACKSRTITQTLSTCPGGCLLDSTGCAPTCDPAACRGESLSGAPSCAYNYIQYVLEQTIDTKSCQPRSGGGEACVTSSDIRFKDTCPYGCNAERTACAPRSAAPKAPGEFLMVSGATEGTLEFSWKDNSDNEQGFRVYHGARFADPPRPSYLIQTVAADTTSVVVTYTRSGDYCFEVYAYNASGESAPAYYCTGF